MEYERGIVFTLGRFTGVRGPGLIILIPFVQADVRADLRVVVQDVPPARRDHARQCHGQGQRRPFTSASSTRSERSIRSRTFMAATSQLAQTTLRSVLENTELDELLAERESAQR